MAFEIISIVSIFVGGILLIRTAGINGWFLPGVGFIVGLCIFIIIGTIQVLTPISTSPIITMGLTLILPLIWWVYCARSGYKVLIDPINAALILSVVVISVIVFRKLLLVSVTVDSFYYMTLGSLLESNNLNHASPHLLLTRLLAVPLIHAPANLSGEFYLRSITPLLAISSLICLAWLVYEGLRTTVNEISIVKYFTVAAALLFMTSYRFIHSAFYINGHLLTATLILLLVGCGWLTAQKSEISAKALIGIQLITIPVLTVLRPETSLLASVSLIPFLTSDQIDRKKRILVLTTLGISILAWHGYLWFRFSGVGVSIPQSVIGMLMFGIGVILVIPLMSWRKAENVLLKSNILVESGLWLMLFLMASQNPARLIKSVNSTYQNIMLDYGGWGVFVVTIGFISVGVLLFTRAKNRIFLRYPLTAFIPFSFLLAYLREGSYRVGFGDSLNRMLLHIIPLAILFIVSAAASERWGFSEKIISYWKKLKI